MVFPDAKLIDIDLTSGEIRRRLYPGELYRLYPGGSSLGLYILLNEMDPKVDPLSPENMLVLSVSPIQSNSNNVVLMQIISTSKSLLTNTVGDSQAGGFFPEFKREWIGWMVN